MQATVDIEKALSLQGWMSLDELLWLATKARESRLIVEFGSFQGRSTRAMADNLMPNGVIWAVDPWSGEYPGVTGEDMKEINTYCYPIFQKNLMDHIVADRVVPYRGFSYRFRLPFEVDMVFIDGDHRYETVCKDIDSALRLLKSGGTICGHDYQWEGVCKAVHEKLDRIEVKDTIWFTTKS